MLHVARRLRSLQEPAQLADGSPGASQVPLETIEMGNDQPVTRLGVGCGEDRLTPRQVSADPQPADDLRDGNLILGVVAIAVAGSISLGSSSPTSW